MIEFNITNKQKEEIKYLFENLNIIKELLFELKEKDNPTIYDFLINKLSNFQQKYNDWFTDIEKELKIETKETQSWNVDFNRNKIQLIGE